MAFGTPKRHMCCEVVETIWNGDPPDQVQDFYRWTSHQKQFGPRAAEVAVALGMLFENGGEQRDSEELQATPVGLGRVSRTVARN